MAFETEVVINGPQENVFCVVHTSRALAAVGRPGPGRRRGHRAPFQLGDPFTSSAAPRPARRKFCGTSPSTTGPTTPSWSRRTGPVSPTPSSGRATTPPSAACSSLARCWSAPATTPVHQGHREGRERERERW